MITRFRFLMNDGRELIGGLHGSGGACTEVNRVRQAVRLAAKGRPLHIYEPQTGCAWFYEQSSSEGVGPRTIIDLREVAHVEAA